MHIALFITNKTAYRLLEYLCFWKPFKSCSGQ